MNYIRIDNENTHNMVVSFSLWPYDADNLDDDVFGFVSSFCELEYDAAANLAMKLLKDPKEYLRTCDSVEDKDSLAKKLEEIQGYSIIECLNVFDKDWVVINCPEDYIFDVGTVFKEEEPSSPEQWS